MSLLGMAAAGAAAAGMRTTEKYIDEGLAQQRAQMMADLQLESAKRLDQYQNDPTRRAGLRDQAALDAGATADATNAAALRGKKAEVADTELTAGMAGRESLLTRARAKADQDATTEAGSNPAFLKAKRALAMAGHVESAGSLASANLANLQAADLKRLGGLYDQAVAIQNDDKLTEDEKAKRLKPIVNTITAIKSKTGQGAARDPELDRVKVTDVEELPGGRQRTTERTEVRRPGQGGEADDPVRAALEAARRQKQPAAASAPAQGTPAAEPGLIDRAKQAVSSARAEGAAYQAIDTRVREAGRGGPPLTPQERVQAQKFGIAVPR
jgi:hypothetical protein